MAATGATNVRKKPAPASITRRKYPRIDIHTHVELPEVKELAGKIKMRGKGPGKQDWVSPASAAEHTRQTKLIMPKLTDPKVRLKDMDAMGVDIQVLSSNLPTPAYWANGKTGQAVARACNEGVAGMVSADPDRFVGIGAVPLQDIDRAIDELDYAVNALGLRGAIIPSNIRNHDLGEEMFRPFWAKAEELDVPVFMHPNNALNIVREDALAGRADLGNVIGNPLETTVFLSHMIFDGVLDRFPGLKICAAHGGGYIPSYVGRTEVACAVRPNANCANQKDPSEYLRDQIFVDSIVFAEEGLRHLVAETGVSQVVYGSDQPYNWPDTIGVITDSPSLSNADKEAILGGNLIRLLRINR